MSPETHPETQTEPEDIRLGIVETVDESFRRTGIVIRLGSEDGSFDLVDDMGQSLARINVFLYHGSKPERLVVDVMGDVERFDGERLAFAFPEGRRQFVRAAKLVSADFAAKKDGES